MSKTLFPMILLGSALTVLWLPGCFDDREPGKEEAVLSPKGGVARITLDGGGFDLRKPGDITFKPAGGMLDLERGSTIRTRSGIVTLNFMGSDVIQISEKTELILEGRVNTDQGTKHVVGLRAGEVRINPNADFPMVLKMPHGEVRSRRAFFSVDLKQDDEGKYSAVVTAFGKDMQITNTFGTLTLPTGGLVRVDEEEPPTLLKDQRALRSY